MDLYLRKVDHGAMNVAEGYRVILKEAGEEIEIGSISVGHGANAQYFWKWAIDNVITMREIETAGRGADRASCMRAFRAAWERFAADPATLTPFLAEKRKRMR